MKRGLRKFIGDKAFYKMVFAVLVPIIIQNGITNFVSLLDNIMVGQIGTEQMSGVSIVNQLIFVFNIAVFGVISGPGIFGAQFFGCGKHEGVRHTCRFKLMGAFAVTVAASVLFLTSGDKLIDLYLHGEEYKDALEATLYYGKQYLMVILIGLPPFAFVQCYSGTLRECGETMLPMKAGTVAVFVNLILNLVLINGWLGFPKLGVVGAAIATVLSRYVEMAIVVIWTHKHKDRYPFIDGAYKSLYIPGALVGKIFVKGAPLMLNEIMWALGMAIINQCYSVRGLDVVAGMNICSTISNLFGVVYIAMGSAVAIIIGQLLGAGKMEEAKETDVKLLAFSIGSCIIIGALLFAAAPLFPKIYNTTDYAKELARSFIRIVAIFMPMYAFLHSCYFTLRAGGKTVVTFVFDSVFMWVVSIPFAYVLSRYTNLPIVPLYFSCQAIELIKCVIGFVFLKKGIWLSNIVEE